MRLTADIAQDNIVHLPDKSVPDKTVTAGKATIANNEKLPANKIVAPQQRLETLKKHFDEKTLKRMGVVECTTCATRTYQDESDDSGVSFQSPTRLSPERASSAVRNHEQEHVVREQASAEKENKEIVSQSVRIFHSTCPECGTSYVSGGVTRTTTSEKKQMQAEAYQGPIQEKTIGNLVDYSL